MAVGGPNLFATDSAGFQASVQVLIQKALVDTLRRGLSWLPREIGVPAIFVPGTGTPASKYTFRAFSIEDLVIDSPPVPLVEGTPPTPTTLKEDYFDVIASQYGKTVKSTDIAILESPFNIPGQMTDKIIRWGAETMDELARLAWAGATAGEVVLFPTDSTGAGATAVTNAPRLETYLKAAALLRDKGVPPASSGNYIALISSQSALALETQTGQLALTEARAQAAPGDLKGQSIGVWHGVDFRVVGRKIAPTGTTVRDIVAGAGAMGYSELSQIQSGYVPPVPSAADPLGQTAYAGTKFFFGCGVCTVGGVDVASSLRYVVVQSTPPTLP